MSVLSPARSKAADSKQPRNEQSQMEKSSVGKRKPEKDEKEQESIDRLKAVNVGLRSRIKELNAVVEKAIEKANQKRVISQKHKHEQSQDIPHLLLTRDLEIQNAQKQIEINDYEINKLSARLQDLQGADKLLQLEQKVKEFTQQKADLEKNIKAMEKQNNDQGKALDKLTNGVDNPNRIRNLVEELRVWKEKVKALENSCKKNRETRLEQIERIKRIEQENAVHKDQLQTILSKKKPKEDIPQPKEEVAQQDKEQLKQEFLEEERQQKKELAQMEHTLGELTAKTENLRKDLKEKEQECRIAQFKLTEMKRSVKHNQLKPLRKEEEDVILNKQALKQLNQMSKGDQSPTKQEKMLNKFEQEDFSDQKSDPSALARKK